MGRHDGVDNCSIQALQSQPNHIGASAEMDECDFRREILCLNVQVVRHPVADQIGALQRVSLCRKQLAGLRGSLDLERAGAIVRRDEREIVE